jgi:hypothetical protein
MHWLSDACSDHIHSSRSRSVQNSTLGQIYIEDGLRNISGSREKGIEIIERRIEMEVPILYESLDYISTQYIVIL